MSDSFTSAAIDQFNTRAREALAERGMPATLETIARILGVPTSTYGNVLARRQRMSLDVLGEWLTVWNTHWPRLGLYLNHTGVLIIREDRLAEALQYDGNDVLGRIGNSMFPMMVMTSEGPKRFREIPVPVEIIECIGGVWRTKEHGAVVADDVVGWAYFTPHREAPGSRTAVLIYLNRGRELPVAYVDGPSLMRLFRSRGERRPDVPMPA